MITLNHVYREYIIAEGELFVALKDVSIRIGDGELTAIVGPSGSGKSTLIHMIGLLDQPTRGRITVNNRDIAKLSDDALSTLRNEFVGFVFQQFNLINKLTVLENIVLPTIYARKKLSFNPHDRGLDLIERFGLKSKENSYPNKISGGQQQRVAIARALIMEPQLILADEPTGNLDTKTGKEILELLLSLNKKNKITVVIVTHDPTIAAITKRTIRMVDGAIV